MLLAGCADETITHMFDTDDDGELINPSMDVLFKIFGTCLLPKKDVLGCPSVLTIDPYDCYFFQTTPTASTCLYFASLTTFNSGGSSMICGARSAESTMLT